MLTRASVHWAERIVATSSWNGFSWSQRAQLLGAARVLDGQSLPAPPWPDPSVIAARPSAEATAYVGQCRLACRRWCASSRWTIRSGSARPTPSASTACSTRAAAADGHRPLSEQAERVLDRPGGRDGVRGPAGPPDAGDTARRLRACSPGAGRRWERRGRRRPGRPDGRRRRGRHCSRPPSAYAAEHGGGDGPLLGVHGRRRPRRRGGRASVSASNGPAASCGSPSRSAASVRPAGPPAGGPAVPARRRRGGVARGRTTGPSPTTPSRAAGTWRRCRRARPSRGSTRPASCSTRTATAGWPGRAGPRCTGTSTPPLGEIYVISRRPRLRTGGASAGPSTVAGLDWLASLGLSPRACSTSTGPTPAAVGLYRSLGFMLDHVDRAYVLDVRPGPTSDRRRPTARPMP